MSRNAIKSAKKSAAKSKAKPFNPFAGLPNQDQPWTIFKSEAPELSKRTFTVMVDVKLMSPMGFAGGTLSSDQLWSHVQTKEKLEAILEVINEGIEGWQKSLKAHNEQECPDGYIPTQYCLETGDMIPDEDDDSHAEKLMAMVESGNYQDVITLVKAGDV